MEPIALMYVAVGGAFGSMARYTMMTLIGRVYPSDFPYGTFAVNILGGFLMGVWIGSMATMMPSKARDLHLLCAVGVLGGFTTFSAFSMDLFLLIERGLLGQAAAYALGSVALSVGALMAGMWLVRLISA